MRNWIISGTLFICACFLFTPLQANKKKCVPEYVKPLLENGSWIDEDGSFGFKSSENRSYKVGLNGVNIQSSSDLEHAKSLGTAVTKTEWVEGDNSCIVYFIDQNTNKTETLHLYPEPKKTDN